MNSNARYFPRRPSPLNLRPLEMYYKHPHEPWYQKGIRAAEGALQIYGTARGVYEVGSAVASALRTGYQIAAPALAML